MATLLGVALGLIGIIAVGWMTDDEIVVEMNEIAITVRVMSMVVDTR
jgi:hypothetical protein